MFWSKTDTRICESVRGRSLIGQCLGASESLSQLVFALALHFVQHLDGSPPGHGQPVQTHSCSLLQPQRHWPTSALVMSTPGSDDLPGSPAAPEAAAEDARAQALRRGTGRSAWT